MPIGIENGTALNPQATEALPEEHTVNIQHHFQEGKLWCWAACIQMVLELKGDSRSQCEIVKVKLADTQHQCPPDPQLRVEACEAVLMAKTWRNCGVQGVVPKDFDLNIQEIKTEIAANRPIQVGILWSQGGGHAVLIKGWAPTSPETLVIDDPLRDSPLHPAADGSGRATHDELLAAFGHGSWRYTWTNLQ